MREHTRKIKKYGTHAALIAALVFILWYGSMVTQPLEAGVVSFSGIVWRGGAYVKETAASIGVFFKRKQALVAENNELVRVLEIARAERMLFDSVRQENELLKSMMGRADRARGILGTVLSRPNHSPYDIFLIDIGKDHTVAVGSLVTLERALIGVVDTVYARTAKVRLFSSAGYELPVILGSEKIPVIARGLGGGMFEIKIPHGMKIAERDSITYPSIYNYLVGTVARVESKPADSVQTILFRAPINIFTLQFVTVTDDLIISIEEQ